MEHIESSTKIYFTDDLSRFKNLKGNRLLSEPKIKRIIRDISNGINFLPYCPIIVDEELHVVDGQHRLQVARMIKSKIWYVFRRGETTLQHIAKINSNMEKWKNKDFLNCFIMQGSEDYKYLEKFQKDTGFNLSLCVRMLHVGSVSEAGGDKDIFNAGRFKATHKKYAETLRGAVQLFSDFIGHTDRQFVIAIDRLMKADKINVADLLEKFEKYPELLVKCGSVKEYLRCFEELYNHRLKQRVVIFD